MAAEQDECFPILFVKSYSGNKMWAVRSIDNVENNERVVRAQSPGYHGLEKTYEYMTIGDTTISRVERRENGEIIFYMWSKTMGCWVEFIDEYSPQSALDDRYYTVGIGTRRLCGYRPDCFLNTLEDWWI